MEAAKDERSKKKLRKNEESAFMKNGMGNVFPARRRGGRRAAS